MPVTPIIGGYITSGYGKRKRKNLKGEIIEEFHHGIDISCKSSKVIIRAAYSGTIHVSGWSDSFGWRVWIKINDNCYAVYAHMLKDSLNPNFKPGYHVTEKDYIGIMSNSGLSSGEHLHFELRVKPVLGAKSINPNELVNIINSQ